MKQKEDLGHAPLLPGEFVWDRLTRLGPFVVLGPASNAEDVRVYAAERDYAGNTTRTFPRLALTNRRPRRRWWAPWSFAP